MQAIEKNRLLRICAFFLTLEERMQIERRLKMAEWARRQYERYQTRLEAVKRNAGRELEHKR